MILVNEVLGAAWNGDGREALGMLCRIQGCSKCPQFGIAGMETPELSFLSASTKNKPEIPGLEGVFSPGKTKPGHCLQPAGIPGWNSEPPLGFGVFFVVDPWCFFGMFSSPVDDPAARKTGSFFLEDGNNHGKDEDESRKTWECERKQGKIHNQTS